MAVLTQETCKICNGLQWLRRWNGNDSEAYPCPCTNPEAKRIARLQRYSELPHEGSPRTFANFEQRPAVKAAYNAALGFANQEGGHTTLTLSGRFGSGKSHLLEAIGRQALANGHSVKYALAPDLLDRLRDSYDPEAETRFKDIYASYEKAEWLLLDDLGAEKPSEWACEKLTRLIDDRYRNGKRLAVATNLHYKVMIDKLGERVADRLFDNHTGIVKAVIIVASSFRQEAKNG